MAAVHLGEVGDPVTGETHKNLPAAGQMVDLLAVVQEKTKGNLDAEEGQLLESLLYELRLKYIEGAKDGGPRIITP
jgi:hypothetical protein